jgi:hypothetical protein
MKVTGTRGSEHSRHVLSTRLTAMSLRPHWLLPVVCAAGLSVIGCSSRHGDRPLPPIAPECEAYVRTFRTCMSGMATPDVASARVAELEATLRQSLSVEATAHSVIQSCQSGAAELQRRCPQAPFPPHS